MHRKATKQSPGPSAVEKRFIKWTADQDCICCENPGPSIVHHCWGATRKETLGMIRVQTGHLAVIPVCPTCDGIITNGSRRGFINEFNLQSNMWVSHARRYPDMHELDPIAILAIAGCGE